MYYYLALYVRAVLAGVLAASAYSHLADRTVFQQTVASYEILPDSLVRPVSGWLPVAQLVLAVWILSGWQSAGSVVAFCLLMFLYMAAIAMNLARGRTWLDCGCGGVLSHERLSWRLVVRNLGLAAAAGVTLPLQASADHGATVPGLVVTGSLGIISIVAYRIQSELRNATAELHRVQKLFKETDEQIALRTIRR